MTATATTPYSHDVPNPDLRDHPGTAGESLAVRAGAPEVLELPAVGGLTWSALVPDHRDDLATLVARIEEVDDPPYRTSAEELLEYFDSGHDFSGIGGRDASGMLRSYAFVRVRHSDVAVLQALCSGGVDPSWRDRGVGGAVIDWQLGRARQMLVETGKEAPARIVVHVDEDADVLAGELVARGLVVTRRYSEMRRDLSNPVPAIPLDHQLSIEPWTEELDDAVRRAHNKAFADAYGGEAHTPETWVQGRTHFEPRWSFVALDRASDRAQVAGYLMSGRYEQDWAALGWSEGYTELLGVLPDWRGRHVATALLTAAMRAYAADGMEYAGLDVDTDDPAGLESVFSKLGYERTRSSALYALDI